MVYVVMIYLIYCKISDMEEKTKSYPADPGFYCSSEIMYKNRWKLYNEKPTGMSVPCKFSIQLFWMVYYTQIKPIAYGFIILAHADVNGQLV